MWDRPVGKTLPGQQQQQQQQQQQETQTKGSCAAAGGVSEASASAAAGAAQPAAGTSSSSSSSIPRSVTVLWYPEDYPPVTNHRELVQMLEELTEPYGFTVCLPCPYTCFQSAACCETLPASGAARQ
jgi:hypothetical protein